MKTTKQPSIVDFERPLTTVDVCIFSVQDDALNVLLVRRPDAGDEPGEPFPARWALPGGFVDVERDLTLEACAARKLRDKTGVVAPYLEQLGSWGDRERDPRGWSATHAYFALVPGSSMALAADPAVQWFEVDAALHKRLAFDHNRILAAALARLRAKVEYTSLPAYLLPEPFTLPQLQQMYERVLGRPVDKSAFRKRMLDAEFMLETGMIDGGAGRTAMGYKLLDRGTAATFPRTFKSRE